MLAEKLAASLRNALRWRDFCAAERVSPVMIENDIRIVRNASGEYSLYAMIAEFFCPKNSAKKDFFEKIRSLTCAYAHAPRTRKYWVLPKINSCAII